MEETKEVETPRDAGAAEETSREVAELREQLALAEKENAELTDKHLRLAAEYENFRRRASAERTAAYTDGLEGALSTLLPILDNLALAAHYEGGAGMAEGLAMIERAASEALTALGVEVFGEVGDAFDPTLHNAVMHTEDESRGESEIAAVHQRGYKKGDRILRYAMVTVAN